ncbi:G-rich sequence factor 1 [Corythoichthys intestinalis]|uniref:G-rich sequence factor 1 n=1 Tax=Corythoichthys intestinalis TaxID=161448 RepID=UPI0025A582B5|nr:G-rich sequence factor 1 [Corythoichthys intestinalis]XP_057688334.1 G-rich sequence factor 1 [Corythoichthys intestinalis]XP_061811451.1 G-rich sequence factor 1-like [Nerophis lumbriciformis]
MCASSRSVLTFFQRCLAVSHQTRTTNRRLLLSRPSWTLTSTGATVGPVPRGFCRHQYVTLATTNKRSLCSKASCEEEYPPLPAYQSDTASEEKNEVYIVHVKGLPWSCTAQDLLHFFSECRIRDGVSGVHLTVDHQGRPSGRAFVEMEHEEDVGKALQKHRQYLGHRYVEVYEVSNSDAEGILKKAVLFPADTRVVRIRGLPFTCTENDIVRFFSGLEIVEKGITMVLNSRGRRTGEAFVWFSSQEAADEALRRDRDLIGNRYIEVFPSSSREINSNSRNFSQSVNDTTSVKRSSLATTSVPNSKPSDFSHHVHLRGLPLHVSGEDIIKFFTPVAVSKILLELGPDGRPSGEADVYFTNHRDAVAAMSKDRMYIGERYIELFLNSEPENQR